MMDRETAETCRVLFQK